MQLLLITNNVILSSPIWFIFTTTLFFWQVIDYRWLVFKNNCQKASDHSKKGDLGCVQLWGHCCTVSCILLAHLRNYLALQLAEVEKHCSEMTKASRCYTSQGHV
uniref:Uncharacterized protein n=1 Tax=Micrurus spixii TaxID=129469 RepID=A0A2D4LB07_9SAUR